MNTFEYWLIYALTVFVASIIPGPSMLLALVNGVKYGAKQSISTALGNTTASMIQATIAIAGLGVVLTTSTTLFMIIKYIGAAYLVYIGIKLFKTSFIIKEETIQITQKINHCKLFKEAFIIAASNPKALIFFTALFPQFIQANNSSILHSTLLVVILGAIAFICMMIYSFSGYKIKDLFNKTSLSKYIGKVIGTIFIGLGASLAIAKR